MLASNRERAKKFFGRAVASLGATCRYLAQSGQFSGPFHHLFGAARRSSGAVLQLCGPPIALSGAVLQLCGPPIALSGTVLQLCGPAIVSSGTAQQLCGPAKDSNGTDEQVFGPPNGSSGTAREVCGTGKATKTRPFPRSRKGLFAYPLAQVRDRVFAIKFRDETNTDFRGANRFTFVGVGAVAEPFRVHLTDHPQHTPRPLGLHLREEREMRNLRGSEEHGGSVRTSRGAGAAADAGCGFHREIGAVFWDQSRVGLRRRTSARTHESAGLHDAIEGRAIDDQVFDNGKRSRAERLDRDGGAVVEAAHVKLAGGGGM